MTISLAKQISIIDYLASCGYKPVKASETSAFYCSPLRNERTASFHVDISKNLWYDHGIAKGGTIIDLVMEMERCSSVTQALALLSERPHQRIQCPAEKQNPTLRFVATNKLHNMNLLLYLQRRCIPIEIAQRVCIELHYEIRGRNYYGIGFRNDSGGYELRNQFFKGCIAPKDITTIIGNDALGRCKVFEGFFDYMSYLVIKGEVHNAIILNSIVNINRAITILRGYENVELFLDNDQAGRKATARFIAELDSRCEDKSGTFFPDSKDLNEWLCRQKRHKCR